MQAAQLAVPPVVPVAVPTPPQKLTRPWLQSPSSLLVAVSTHAAVLVDEAQFLQPAQVRQLHRLAHVIDLPVICYGIRTDFRGEGFHRVGSTESG